MLILFSPNSAGIPCASNWFVINIDEYLYLYLYLFNVEFQNICRISLFNSNWSMIVIQCLNKSKILKINKTSTLNPIEIWPSKNNSIKEIKQFIAWQILSLFVCFVLTGYTRKLCQSQSTMPTQWVLFLFCWNHLW